MQHTLATCQLRAPETAHVAPKSTPGSELASGRQKRWAPDPAETIAHTSSRHTGPRAWLRALERAVAAGLIPGFNATTQAVVDVIASRMGYDTGHARYVMRDVMERTGLGKTAVTDHVKLLRAGGWLAWVEHGSLRNALRNIRPGYARTATVYAATIPPAHDRLMGHTVIGSGYEARIIIDRRPGSAVETAVDTAGIEAVENLDVEPARTPSLWVDKEEGQVLLVGGNNRSTADAAASKIPRRKKKHTVTGYRITGERIDRARQLAVSVRPHVNWIQGASHDQLSWVLLDLVARDWSESRIVLWLRNLGQEIGVRRWRPRFPHRVIAAAIRRDDQAAAQRAITVGPDDEPQVRAVDPNTAFQAARERIRIGAPRMPVVEMPTLEEEPEDAWGRALLREAAAADPALILSFARHEGRDATLRVYGTAAARILDDAHEFGQAGFTVTA